MDERDGCQSGKGVLWAWLPGGCGDVGVATRWLWASQPGGCGRGHQGVCGVVGVATRTQERRPLDLKEGPVETRRSIAGGRGAMAHAAAHLKKARSEMEPPADLKALEKAKERRRRSRERAERKRKPPPAAGGQRPIRTLPRMSVPFPCQRLHSLPLRAPVVDSTLQSTANF
ncbi:unnamed protein product [Boreogadus saida]